ncbi:MAG: primosomal protein, partial [Candidatus Thorarchaeota archaeon]
MKKKLLREWYALEYTEDLIKESCDKNNGKIILPAILQKAHLKNQNGRVYPTEILQREVVNYEKVVSESRALGELDHPETSTVALDRASHIVREIYWEGDVVRGTIEVLNTPKGNILKDLLQAGVRIGMSSRGVGSTEQTNEGTDIVQDDYQLICFDAV